MQSGAKVGEYAIIKLEGRIGCSGFGGETVVVAKGDKEGEAI
jgi:hypothetical protein